jgi:Cysteine-rich CWC
MSDGARLDPSLCPLCGAANQCAMEIEKTTGVAQPPCWCSTLHIDAQRLEQIPPASRGRACICLACAQRPLTTPALNASHPETTNP